MTSTVHSTSVPLMLSQSSQALLREYSLHTANSEVDVATQVVESYFDDMHLLLAGIRQGQQDILRGECVDQHAVQAWLQSWAKGKPQSKPTVLR